jgi:hypothetical protein
MKAWTLAPRGSRSARDTSTYRIALIVALGAALLLSACGPKVLSADEQKLVAELKAERSKLQGDIAQAEMIAGRGLIGAFASVRLEALRPTEALLGQRITAIETGAPMRIEQPIRATQPEPERAASLLIEIAAQERKVQDAERRAAKLAFSFYRLREMTAFGPKADVASVDL